MSTELFILNEEERVCSFVCVSCEKLKFLTFSQKDFEKLIKADRFSTTVNTLFCSLECEILYKLKT